MKKLLALTLALVMVLMALPTVMAASTPTMTMSSSSGHEVGDTVTLTISFDYGDNKIKAIAMDSFTYDKDVLKLKSLNWELAGFLTEADPNGDSLLAFTTATNVSDAVMTAEFEVIGHSSDLTQEITFNAKVTPESGSNIDVATSAGVITLNPVKISGTQAITGVTAPVKKNVPVSANDITAPENTTITSIVWNPNHGVFAGDTAYSATINIKANDGYKFNSGVTFTVDGASWTSKKQADGSYNLTKTFPKTAGKDTPVCIPPSGLTATYGQKLSDITLTNPVGNTSGTWTWVYPTTTVGNVGSKTFKAKFVPTDVANYLTDEVDVPVIVNAKNITVSIATISDKEYTGSQIKPTVTVTGDGKTLVLNTDYTVEYGENVKVGTASVIVKAKTNGNYNFADTTKNFNIVAKAGKVSITGTLSKPYGEEIPDVTINKNGSDGATTIYYYTNSACTEGKTTIKPTNAGKYWVQVEMAAGTNFGAAVSNVLSFTISRANITPSVSIEGWTYKASASVPSVTGNTGNGAVTYKYKVKGASDSTYTTTIPTKAGNYTVKAEIAETTNYNAGSATVNFTISPKALDNAMVAEIASQSYTGSAIKPVPVVTDGTALVNNTDFTYSYENNTYVGTATVKLIGKGNYTGTITKEFAITAIDQTPALTATTSVRRGGNTVDLKRLVSNAKGTVTFEISGEANGCTIANGVLTSGENQGTVKVNVAITAKDINNDSVNEYNAYSLTDAITVTITDKEPQAELKITSATTVTYGKTLTLTSRGGSGSGAVTYTVTSGTGEATIEGNVLTPVKAGTVTVVATKAGNAVYNDVSSETVVITIEKIKVAIPTADTRAYTYNGAEQTYRITANNAYTIEGNVQTNANETGYTVTVALKNTDTHAWTDGTIEAKTYNFVIKKATIKITAKNQSIYVNGTVPTLSETSYTVTGLANGETLVTLPTVEYETTPDATTVGAVAILVSGAVAPEGDNYNEIVYANGTLNIRNMPVPTPEVQTPVNYTVKFETNGANAIDNVTVKENGLLSAPTAPIKEGFTFDGWYTDSEFTTAYDFTAKVTKNFTLFAKWTEVEDPVFENKYTDIKEDDWFYSSVATATMKGLFNGVSENEFAPKANLSRAMLATILYRLAGSPEVTGENTFVDVNSDAWYSKAVIWASANGIVNGVGNNKFAPDANVTREQIATMLYRFAKLNSVDTTVIEDKTENYTDSTNISSYALDAMKWSLANGIINGDSETTVSPSKNATRAEAATLIIRFADLFVK